MWLDWCGIRSSGFAPEPSILRRALLSATVAWGSAGQGSWKGRQPLPLGNGWSRNRGIVRAPDHISVVLVGNAVTHRGSGCAFHLVVLGNRLSGADHHDRTFHQLDLPGAA